MIIPRGKKGWRLVAGVVILAGIASVPAVADEGTEEDPFGALSVVAEDDLEAARGGDDTITESFNTTIITKALNDVTATIGTINISAGSISGGAVAISDNALASFSGIVTQAFVTAPGSIATATTALTVTLIP